MLIHTGAIQPVEKIQSHNEILQDYTVPEINCTGRI